MTGCFGLCARGPIVVVYPDGAFYQHVKVSDVEIVREHIVGGTVVERLLHEEKDVNGESNRSTKPLSTRASIVVLRHCGLIDPENIDEYLAFDGYLAYKKAVRNDAAAGYRYDQSQRTSRQSGNSPRYGGSHLQLDLIEVRHCNATRRPGAFMDRSVLEGDPHRNRSDDRGYAISATKVSYTSARNTRSPFIVSITIKQAREWNPRRQRNGTGT
ncbi:MAG: hypothetical protein ACLUSP_00610 [Christensenellales bacterium]